MKAPEKKQLTIFLGIYFVIALGLIFLSHLLPRTVVSIGLRPVHVFLMGFLMMAIGITTFIIFTLYYKEKHKSYKTPIILPTQNRIIIDLSHLIPKEKKNYTFSKLTIFAMIIYYPYSSYENNGTLWGNPTSLIFWIVVVGGYYFFTRYRDKKTWRDENTITKGEQLFIVDEKGIRIPLLLSLDPTRRKMMQSHRSHIHIPWQDIIKIQFITSGISLNYDSTKGSLDAYSEGFYFGSGTPYIQFSLKGQMAHSIAAIGAPPPSPLLTFFGTARS